MTTQTREFVAVALTKDEARVWSAGHVKPGSVPEKIEAPTHERRHHHVREAQHHTGQGVDRDSAQYFESITASVAGAHQILVIGHGTGKASAMTDLVGYWELKHPEVARCVVAMVDSDLAALSEGEVLAFVREWFEDFL